ncbi:MAG: phosphatidate cytidylyltransferase [Candidatus Acidiferrum sp.]
MTSTRVLTALVLIPIVLAVVLLTPTYVVAIAVALITIQALREYFALGDAIGHRAYRFWTVLCSLLLIVQCWCPTLSIVYRGSFAAPHIEPISNSAFPPSPDYLFTALISPAALFFLFLLGLTVVTLFTHRPLVESLPAAGISSSALLLVAFPFSFAVRLHGLSSQGPRLLLFALAITWAADTAAYFVGRAIGKHPLAPHISPKKTWEGSLGGILGSLLIAYAASFFLPIPLPHLLAMAFLGNIVGQMGDLLESAYKRSAGVKDSGTLLPGHGGVLDRIDAQILCIPVIWYYLVLVNPPLLAR